MTLKQSQRLVARQAGKISLATWEKVSSDKRINPRLAESIFFNSSNGNVLDRVHYFLIERVVAGDKSALNVLVRASDEGLNKNMESRQRAVFGLRNLAFEGELGALPGLLKAVNDSDVSVRSYAVSGLRYLAKVGNKQAQEKLIQLGKKW